MMDTGGGPAMTDTGGGPAMTEGTAPEAERRYGAAVSDGGATIHPARDEYVAAVEAARSDGFVMCIDLCAVDYLERPPRDIPPGIAGERFEVVLQLLSMDPPRRLKVRVQVPEGDPRLPTLFNVYPGTEAMEREAFDLMGIVFDGHPDLTRILMPEDWEGHPLRKDYSIGRIPVQFKAAPSTR
jgi:NADH-quinone oxidoreductase subunit C